MTKSTKSTKSPPAEPREAAYISHLLTGLKHDATKNRLDLVPPELVLAVGAVMTYGAEKYDDHNWAGGMRWSRLIAASLRHLMEFNAGVDIDSESGLPHLAHAATCIGFLIAYAKNGWGEDDRRDRVLSASLGKK